MRTNDNDRMDTAEAILGNNGFRVHRFYRRPGKSVIVAIGTVDCRTVSLRLHARKISVEWGDKVVSENSVTHGDPETLVATVLAGKGAVGRRLFAEAKP